MIDDKDDLERVVSRSLHDLYPLGPAEADLEMRRPRRRVALAAVGSGVALAAAVAAIVVAVSRDGSQPSSQRSAAGLHSTSIARSSMSTTRSAADEHVLNSRYRLFVHCGVPRIDAAGRAWAPAKPVPTYPGPAPRGGVTTDDGYATGVLTQVNESTLRFDATDTANPFSVTFKPAAAQSSTSPARRVCA